MSETLQALGWVWGMGVVSLGTGIWSSRVRRRRHRTWRREQAWAVGSITRASGNSQHRYLLYERRDQWGGYRVVESLANVGWSGPRTFPCLVDVLVDPEDPYRVQEAADGGQAVGEVLFMCIGTAALVVGAVLTVRGLI